MNNMFIFAIIFLSFTILLCMIRAIKGPQTSDRIISINIIGTKVIIIIAFVSFVFHETFFIDVALVYALISFITSIIVAKTIRFRKGE